MANKIKVGQRVQTPEGHSGEVGIIRGNMAQVNGVWMSIRYLEAE